MFEYTYERETRSKYFMLDICRPSMAERASLKEKKRERKKRLRY